VGGKGGGSTSISKMLQSSEELLGISTCQPKQEEN